MNSKLCTITAVCIGVLLAACSHFHPPTAAPSQRTQCINLKRQMLFLDANTNNEPYWKLQKERTQLKYQYVEKGCHQILQKEPTP